MCNYSQLNIPTKKACSSIAIYPVSTQSCYDFKIIIGLVQERIIIQLVFLDTHTHAHAHTHARARVHTHTSIIYVVFL